MPSNNTFVRPPFGAMSNTKTVLFTIIIKLTISQTVTRPLAAFRFV